MALEMLDAYYGRGYDSRELFAGLKIENDSSFEEHLNRYDVIYLNASVLSVLETYLHILQQMEHQ